MGVMDLGLSCISLEGVLQRAKCKAKIKPHFFERRLQQALTEARVDQALHRKS